MPKLVEVQHRQDHMKGQRVAGSGGQEYLVDPNTMQLHVLFGPTPFRDPGVYEHDAQEYRQFPDVFRVSNGPTRDFTIDDIGYGRLRQGLDMAKAVVGRGVSNIRAAVTTSGDNPPASEPAGTASTAHAIFHAYVYGTVDLDQAASGLDDLSTADLRAAALSVDVPSEGGRREVLLGLLSYLEEYREVSEDADGPESLPEDSPEDDPDLDGLSDTEAASSASAGGVGPQRGLPDDDAPEPPKPMPAAPKPSARKKTGGKVSVSTPPPPPPIPKKS